MVWNSSREYIGHWYGIEIVVEWNGGCSCTD